MVAIRKGEPFLPSAILSECQLMGTCLFCLESISGVRLQSEEAFLKMACLPQLAAQRSQADKCDQTSFRHRVINVWGGNGKRRCKSMLLGLRRD